MNEEIARLARQHNDANVLSLPARYIPELELEKIVKAWFSAVRRRYMRTCGSEYTAAHNHLPLGAMVRVTHLANGKSVIVRITDRGITDKRDRIDLCKEAAAQLGMLSEGKARVRIEELPDDKRVGANPAPDSKANGAHP